MMKTRTIILALSMLIVSIQYATAQVTDSVDVMDYDLTLDLSEGAPFAGKAVLTVQLERPLATMTLQLMGTVDSIAIDGTISPTTDLAQIPVGGFAAGQPFLLTVWYHGSNYVENYGWGGFHFDRDMSYNLGVAFNEDPHTIGRAMFPCRDNFTDKATYTLRVTTREGWTAECGGIQQSRTLDSVGREHTVWRIGHPTPTYLVSVSQADYHKIHTTAGGYPLTLGFTIQDSARVAETFRQLDTIVPMFERCFGPYRWERIGYIATQKGSMEHVNNIALSRSFMANPSSPYGRITIPHELGHAWFGNLVTCRTEGDMWFNEGGASFTSEVAREATSGRRASTLFYQENLESVIRTAHLTDGGWLPLSPMPHSLTYGTTTYDKGALVWHSLRGYLGDEVFYAAMRRLFSDKAFDNVDAAEVRDSLASYTGVDLDGFFDFHVFGAGFVDYNIEMLGTDSLRIRQQGVGTTALMRQSRVPVTFVGADGETEKRWYTFSCADTVTHIGELPFPVSYCMLDRDCDISDAATRGDTTFTANGQANFPVAHFTAKASALSNPVSVHVEHHWGKPYGLDTVDGVMRTPLRYWTVNGSIDHTSGVSGRFFYSRTSDLDRGFFDDAASLDSIVLMHRYNSRSPWQCISRAHSSNTEEYFYCPLRIGEFALAVVDTARVGIADVDCIQLSLFPNPLHKGESLTINAPIEGPYSVTVYTTDGRKAWSKKSCINGKTLRPNLPTGTYLVVIENKYVSLQSKLIQL